MARVQRARARAGRGRRQPAARAREVLRDRLLEPRRVLHGAGRRPARPDRGGHRDAAAGRPHAARHAGGDPPGGAGAHRAPEPLPGGRPAPGAGRAGHPDRRRRRCQRRGAASARRALPAPDLPRADAARRRPRPPVPVHLQPLAVARRARPRPDHRRRDVRAREGAEGDAAAVRADRRRLHVRAARGADRQAPRLAVPGHGDRRLRRLPRHPRRRLHGLRRGRRPAAGGRGRAARAALRRGRARRGRRRDERGDPRGDHRLARGRARGRVRRPGSARPRGSVGHRRRARLRGAA